MCTSGTATSVRAETLPEQRKPRPGHGHHLQKPTSDRPAAPSRRQSPDGTFQLTHQPCHLIASGRPTASGMATSPPAEGKPWALAAHPRLAKGTVVGVVVLDGWGEAPPDPFNCIHAADTPTLDALKMVRSLRLGLSALPPDCVFADELCLRRARCHVPGSSGEVEAHQGARHGGGPADG